MTVPFNLADLGGDTLASAKSLDPLVSGGFSITEAIGPSDPSDVYKFTLASAQSIDLSLSGLAANARLRLYQADGTQLFDNSWVTYSSNRVSGGLAAGTYYVRVDAGEAADTPYTLKLAATSNGDGSAGHSPLTATSLGALTSTVKLVTDRLDAATGPDYYSFSLAASGSANLKLSGLGNATAAWLTVTDTAGNVLVRQDTYDYADGLVRLYLNAGSYTVSVEPKSGAGSAYSLSAYAGTPTVGTQSAADGAGNSIAAAASITLNAAAPVLGYVSDTGDTDDFYKFTLNAISRVTLQKTGSAADAQQILILTKDSGDVLGELTTDGSVVQTLGPGTYYVQVLAALGSSGYNLQASSVAVPDAVAKSDSVTPTSLGALSAASTVRSDWVGTQAPDDFYSFTLAGTSRVSLRLAAPNGGGSASLTLTDSTGTTYAGYYTDISGQSGAPGQSLRTDGYIERVLAAGTYTVNVHSDYPNFFYTLTASAAPGPDVTPVHNTIAKATSLGALGTTPVSKTDWSGDAAPQDYYSFTLSAASIVTLKLSGISATLPPSLSLVDSDDNYLNGSYYFGNSGDEGTSIFALGAGTYYVRIDNAGGLVDDGAYTLAASAVAMPNGIGGKTQGVAAALPGGITTTPATLSDYVGGLAGSEDWFKFTTTSVQTLNFLARLGPSAPGTSSYPIGVSLVDSNGNPVAGANGSAGLAGGDSIVVADLPAGTYYLHVTTYGGGNSTPYQVTYWSGAPTFGAPAADSTNNSLPAAKPLGLLGTTAVSATDWVGQSGATTDPSDFYSFSVAARSAVTLTIAAQGTGVSGTVDVFDQTGFLVQTLPFTGDLSSFQINLDLGAGAYYVRVLPDDPATGIGYKISAVVNSVLTDSNGRDFATATNLGAVGTTAVTLSGIAESDAVQPDMYRFAVGADSTVTIGLALAGSPLDGLANVHFDVTIYDAAGNQVETRNYSAGGNPALKINLTSGNYYLKIAAASRQGYQLSVSGTAAATTPKTIPGSDFITADPLGVLGAAVIGASGWVGPASPSHYYSFTLDKSSLVNASIAARDNDSSPATLTIYDANNNTVASGTYSLLASGQTSAVLQAGTYFVRVGDASGDHAAYGLTFTAKALDGAAGHTLAAATPISPTATAATVTDWVGLNASQDIYSFTFTSKQTLNVKLLAGDGRTYSPLGYTIGDATGHIVATDNGGASAGAVVLDPGTYYLAVNAGGSDPSSATPYSLSYWTGAVAVGTSTTNKVADSTATAISLGALNTAAGGAKDWVAGGPVGDYYKFTLAKASTVNVSLSGLAAGTALYFTLLDKSEAPLGNYYASASASTIALGPGTYYLNVTSTYDIGYQLNVSAAALPDAAGKTLSLQNIAGKPGALGTLGTTPVTVSDAAYHLPGDLAGADDTDYYIFSIGALSNVTLKLSDIVLKSSYWTIDVINANGDVVNTFSNAQGNEPTIVTTLAAGTYRVAVSAAGQGTVGYKLAFSASPGPDSTANNNTFATAKSVTLPASTTVVATDWVGPAAGQDFYKFTLDGPSDISFELDTLGGDAHLSLLDANGGTIAVDPATSRNAPGSIVASLAKGTYFVEVDGSAQYKLLAKATASPNGSAAPTIATAKALTPTATRQTVTDWIGSGAPDDYYKVTLATATTLNLSLLAEATVLSSVEILDSANVSIASTSLSDNRTGGGITASLAAGTYYIHVNSGPSIGTSSAYTLSYSTGAPPIGTSAADGSGNSLTVAKDLGTIGATAATSIDWVGTTDAVDYYKFTLAGYSLVNFGVNGGTGLYRLKLYDASGKAIDVLADQSSSGNENLVRRYLASGTYYVGLTTTEASFGYNLSVQAGAAQAGAGKSLATAKDLGVNPGSTTLTDVVTNADAEYFRFSLSAATYVDLSNMPSSGGTTTTLLDANGVQVQSASFDASTASIGRYGVTLAAGDYFIMVTGNGSGFNTYALQINPIGIGISSPSVVEGNSGTSNLVFTVTLSAPSSLPVTVNYATSNGTATVGSDYTAATGALTIAAGATTGTISVPVIGDTVLEPNETVMLTLSGATGATFAGGAATLAATGTITNDDKPVATLSAPSIAEGNSGTSNLVFTVTLSGASTTATTFTYATANGTATAGSDYTATTGTLTIAAGSTTGTISVPVTGDTVYEPNETVGLTLSNPVGATFAGGAATLSSVGTISNDDLPVATLSAPSIVEGNSGTSGLVFTVTLSAASSTATSFAYSASNGTATVGSDYTATSGTLTIAAGATTGTITVPVVGDTVFEANETVNLTLSVPNGAVFAGGGNSLTATGTITNDDPQALPVATLAAVNALEGNSGTTNLVFTVTLSVAASTATTFAYATSNGTAVAGSDYTATTGTLTIAAGSTTGTITVPVTGETLYENDETFNLTLSNPSGATFAGGGATLAAIGTIRTDDLPPIATLSSPTVVEGNGGVANLVFTVTLSAASGLPATIQYATFDGSAKAGSDYTSVAGTLTIAAGSTTGTISVPIIGDTIYEGDETLGMRLASPSGVNFAGGAVSLTSAGVIVNDDPLPTATLSTPSVAEGNSGTANLVFIVTLSAASGQATTFAYATSNGSATAGSDYTASTGTLTIAAGATTGTITIAVTGDTVYEQNETLNLTLSSPTGATFPGGATTLAATGTITNDDKPVATLSAPSVAEGNSGTTNLVFTVTLSAASSTATTFTYATSNGTATAGSDYTAATGTLTIAAGATSGTISIPVIGDTLYEPNETVNLTLSNPNGAVFAGGAATLASVGTIANDDKPTATLSAPSIAEGNSGTTNLDFTVTLSAASSTATTFTYATSNGTATAGSDYTAATGTLTIAAGATSGTISIPVIGDAVPEPNETVNLTLSNPNGATFAGGATTLSATGTINNDDLPVATLSAPSIAEGNSGTSNLVFTVTLSSASATATTFTYATSNGTATAGSDYTTSTGTLTIAAGSTTGAISVPVIGDTVLEPNETVNLTLSSPSGAVFAGGATTLAAVGTITNDDLPVASLSAPSVLEGNSGTTNLVFTVTLSVAASAATTFAYATSNGTAAAGSDYAATTGTLTIAAGATSGTITVPVTADTLYEADETLSLTLSNPSGATFSGGGTTLAAIGTIRTDDLPPLATISSPTVVEGSGGAANLVFTVTLSAVSGLPATIQYASFDGGAKAGSDYTSVAGTLTIAAGSTTGTISVPIIGDTIYEGDETLGMRLASPSGVNFAGGAVSLTSAGVIVNDDPLPTATLSTPSVAEGNSGTANLVFIVTLSAASGQATTFAYATSNGSATAGSDYTASTGTLTIAAGATTGTITIAVTGDTVYEQNETLNLTLSSPTGATFPGGATTLAATGTITNDDKPVATLSAPSVAEGNSGTTNLVFTVTLSAASSTATTFTYATANGTATAGSDYTATTGTLTIAAGSTTGTISVPVTGDTVYEPNETVGLTLSNPVGATFAGGAATLAATGTITNDDAAPINDIIRVSTNSSGAQAAGLSQYGAYSPDGTKIVFESNAANLVTGDTNGAIDVFVKDVTTGVVTRASTDASGSQGNGNVDDPIFSPDGTKVAFTSAASNLVPGDTNNAYDIFVKDLTTGAITRVSTDSAGNQLAGYSFVQSFSPDGTKIAFVTGTSVYVKDLTTGTLTRIDTSSAGVGADDQSGVALSVFSPDGTKLAFWSRGTNLVSGDTNGATDIFVKDLATGATTRVSTDSSGNQSSGDSSDQVFSPDGTKIAFVSSASNLVAGDTNNIVDVFIKDLVTGAITRVSTDSTGVQSNSDSHAPVFSSDGTKILFYSLASNLVAGDTNAQADIFVKDLTTGATTRVSTGAGGAQGDGGSFAYARFSPDGAKVVFASDSANLVSGDTNSGTDVFVKTLSTSPTVSIATSAPIKAEGNSGSTPFTFTVSRSSSTGTDSVAWSVVGSGITQANANDFAGGVLPSGTVTFAAGETSKTITVNVAGETTYEANEGFAAVLGTPGSGATLAASKAYATIVGDDAKPVATLSAPSVAEGNSGSTNLVFTVTLSAASATATTFAYATSNGSATAGSDYTTATGTLTIAAGSTTGTISVPIIGDTVLEANETVNFTLSNPNGATFAGGAATLATVGTITNDDASNIVRVSTSSSGAQGELGSYAPVFSPDGTKVAFYSSATTLVAGDTNSAPDIFVKDLATGATTRVSTSAANVQANGNSFLNAVFSPDGTKLAFYSEANNLVANDTNGVADLFLKDLATGAITRLSTDSAGLQVSGGSASDFQPVFSGDGTQIAFQSVAALVAGDSNAAADIFVKNLATGAVSRVSTSAAGTQGDGASGSASFSLDGSLVAFQSDATNLVAGDANARTDIFVKNLATGAITRVSTDAAGVQANGASGGPVLSPDGTKVVFYSAASNLVAGDTNNSTDIFVKDLQTGAITRVSTSAASGQTDLGSFDPVFSPDGTKVAFWSAASNLVSGDTNNTADIFVKDLATGAITRVSVDGNGGQSNGTSNARISFSADGTRVAFQSIAGNLVAGDSNGYYDTFVKTITTGPVFSVAAPYPPAKVEGSSGSTAYNFVVTRSGGATTAQTVNWGVAGTGALAANAADFTGGVLPGGTLSFAVGETAKTVTVNVAGDSMLEGEEGFAVKLSAPSAGSSLATSAAFATIRNDDAKPLATISAPSVVEGNSGTANLVFTVTLSAVSGLPTTLNYATSSGTAVSGTDFTAATGTLTIAAGATTGTISVPVIGETLYEPNETVTLTLSGANGASFAGGAATLAGTGTITNDDKIPKPVAVGMDATLAVGSTRTLASLYTVTATTGDTITGYQVLDSNTTASSGTVSVGGLPQGGGTPATLSVSQFASAIVNAGSAGGIDTIFVRVGNVDGYGAWAPANVTTTAPLAPTISVTDKALTANTAVAASSLYTVTSPGNVPVTALEFLDLTPDATSGTFKVGGVAQTSGAVIDILASQLASTTFLTGASGSSDEIWVRASNGTSWSNWGRLTVTSGTLAA